ncbi:MAG TPA: DUF4340 domain-containing protein [Leptolinea sp.]
MVKKPTIILLAIFVVLGGFAWWFSKSPRAQTGNSTPTATQIPNPLSDWKFENTRLISFKSPDSDPLTIRMEKDFNSWSIDQIKDTPADPGKVIQLLSELSSMKPIAKLESGTDENAMGLGVKAKVITLVDSNDTSIEIQLGGKTVTASGSYIKVGDNGFYIVDTPVLDNLVSILTPQGIVAPTEMPTAINETPTP